MTRSPSARRPLRVPSSRPRPDRALLGLLVCLGVAWPATAAAQASAVQTPATQTPAAQAPAALPAARTIVDRALTVSGEGAAIEKSQFRMVEGTLELAGTKSTGPFRVVQARPDRYIETSELSGFGTVRVGFDGTTTWMQHPTYGTKVLEGITAAQARAENDFELARHDPKRFASLETVDRESYHGHDCYRVRCVLTPFADIDDAKSLPYRTFDELFAVDTGLMAGVVRLEATPEGDKRTETTFDDYSELVPGLQVATRITTRILPPAPAPGADAALPAAPQVLVLHVTKVSLSPLPDSLFNPPTALKVQAKAAAAPKTDGDGGGK